MESSAFKLLEAATYRTLHANSFSRSSSQAAVVLTDLLSRYALLLSSTCAKYAEHAGRTALNARDVLGALDEMGVSFDELMEYGSIEAKELNRYAYNHPRRLEDLHEFKAQLNDGRLFDMDDAFPLFYMPYSPPLSDVEDEDEEDEIVVDNATQRRIPGEDSMDVDMPPPTLPASLSRRPDMTRASPPPALPLSPISIPSSPSRKRPRTASWQPPEHIPDFLPPFPVTTEAPASPAATTPLPSQPTRSEPPPFPVENAKVDKPPLSLSQTVTSTSATDYFVQVPYSQSSLASVSEWHLPSPNSNARKLTVPTRNPQLPIPQTEPALFQAYHHILTHPPPPNSNTPTPARHRVAMALLAQTQALPRWDAPDTLFSSVAPCSPRVATIGPTYPVAIGDDLIRDGKDKDIKFPPMMPRPVSSIERLTPLVSQQRSRIPDLARHVLPPAIYTRTSRLTHPPPLMRGSKVLVYGPGIPAPWNSSPLPSGNEAVPSTPGGVNTKVNGVNGKDEEGHKPLFPDAKLYATWDYDSKEYRVPLVIPARTRTRLAASGSMSGPASASASGSVSGSGNVISLSLSSRGKARQ